MNNEKYQALTLVLSALCITSPAFADVISDAQTLKSQYYGSFQIDAYNPASTSFETMIANQKVELMLNSTSLSTVSLPIISSTLSILGCSPLSRSCNNPSVKTANFSQLAVFLNGCNISAEIVRLCNQMSSGCTLQNPNASGANPTIGSSVTMTTPIVLNQINMSQLSGTSGCSSFFGLVQDAKYTLEFKELDAVKTAGGKLRYDVAVRNQTFN